MYKQLNKEEQQLLDKTYSQGSNADADPSEKQKGVASILKMAAIMLLFIALCAVFFHIVGLRRGSFNQEEIHNNSHIIKMMQDSSSNN